MDEHKKAIEFFEKGHSCPDKPNNTCHQLDRVKPLLGMEKTGEAFALLDRISKENVHKSIVGALFEDLENLASSPRPPQGIRELISTAKEMLI
jgi:hypothetical protein